MIKNRQFPFNHPRAWLILQASTLVGLTFALIPLFSGGKGKIFLLAILGLICSLWIIRKPHWGVLIILAAWFIQIDALGGVPYMVSAILLIPIGLAILRDRTIWVLRVPQIQMFLIIGIIFVISTWWSEFKYPITLFPEEDETTRQLQVFATRLIWLICFLYFITTRQTIEITAWLVLGLILAAAISAVPDLLSSHGTERAAAAFSFAQNSNRLAYICIFATALLWCYCFHTQAPLWKAWLLPILFVLPIVALAAGSRSGFFQILTLAAVILKEQKGWSVTKRAYSIVLIGSVALILYSVIPAVHVARITNFISPSLESPGGQSFHTRSAVVFQALDMVMADPILGIGIGNFHWISHAFYPAGGEAHNSYLWAFTSGGIGAFVSYLLLFSVTYRMLRRLESLGPEELRWLSKGLKVNLFLFLIFSIFADVWLNFFLYLIVGLTIAMSCLWQREEQSSALGRGPYRPHSVRLVEP